VRAVAVGTNFAIGVTMNACTVRDSVILSDGPGSTAVSSQSLVSGLTGVLRNVTAIATGTESTGARAEYTAFLMFPGSYTLNMSNVIAQGSAYDLRALPGPEGPGHIVASNSNFDTSIASGSATITGGNNQTTPPLFVSAAAGDFRPAAGSPTIDAGSTDQIGTVDLAGNPRALGAAPDIGAYEFVPPAVPVVTPELGSLTMAPRTFRPANIGGAIVSARKRKPKVKVGATVRYALTAAATVRFKIERAAKGRRVGKRCVKATRANRKRKKCTRYAPVKRAFSHNGDAGANSFRFSGRIGGRALRPGRYRLVGKAGDSLRRTGFRIVR
jgi:hypothetical protein